MMRTGIKLELDVGDVLSSAGRAKSAIASLTSEMSKAAKAEDWDKFAKLQFDRDRLQTNNTGFEKDIHSLSNKFQGVGANGQPVFKMDPEYGRLMKDQIYAIKKLTAEYNQALQAGDTTKTWELSGQIENKQDEFHKLVQQANGVMPPENVQNNAMKAVAFNQVAGILNDGFSKWVNSLDRSDIVNQYGSGDILGGRLAEKQRQASLISGGIQAASSTAALVATATGNPLLGAGIAAVGQAGSTLVEMPVKGEATEVAYANLWKQRSADAMNLAALSGDPSMVRDTWAEAAKGAEKYGFSDIEGADTVRQALQQGLSNIQAFRISEQAFDIERRTGADRGTLMELSAMSERYGLGDSIATGWAGLNASGMQTGQYNEYLRGIQRVMEDGISKGFLKSSDKVIQSLTMFASMAENDPLWTGENGVRRIMEMDSGFEGATGLQSATDILAYRAAKSLPGMSDKDYVDVMEILEGGVTGKGGAALMHNFMKNIDVAEGGDRSGKTERLRQLTGWNYRTTNEFMRNYGTGEGLTAEQIQKIIEDAKAVGMPDNESPELKVAIDEQTITNAYATAGQSYFDMNIKTYQEEVKKALAEITKAKDAAREFFAPPPPAPDPLRDWDTRSESERTGDYTGNINTYRSDWARDRTVREANISDPSIAEMVNEYKRLVDPFLNNNELYSSIMGSGNIQTFQTQFEAFQRNGIDEFERENLIPLLINAINDMKAIITNYNRNEGTAIQFPDTLNLTIIE